MFLSHFISTLKELRGYCVWYKYSVSHLQRNITFTLSTESQENHEKGRSGSIRKKIHKNAPCIVASPWGIPAHLLSRQAASKVMILTPHFCSNASSQNEYLKATYIYYLYCCSNVGYGSLCNSKREYPILFLLCSSDYPHSLLHELLLRSSFQAWFQYGSFLISIHHH